MAPQTRRTSRPQLQKPLPWDPIPPPLWLGMKRHLCQQRLEKLLPEAERVRAAVKAAIEARRITREALDHNWVKLELEQSQRRDRYEQERDLELEREEIAIRDAEGKVKDLEDDYRTYKNRKAAAQARLRGHPPTGSTDTGPSPGSGRSSAAPASHGLPGDSTDEPPYLETIGAKFSKFRKLRKSYPDMSVQEFAELKYYFDDKEAAARRKDGMDRPGRARSSPESARSEGPRRNIRYDRHRVERRHRGRDSRERHPRDRPSTGPKWEEKSGSFVLALSSLAKIRTSQSQA